MLSSTPPYQHQRNVVFRELLQNSDDASATAVEIRFETRDYLNRKNGSPVSSEDGTVVEESRLPDLKTAVVSVIPFGL